MIKKIFDNQIDISYDKNHHIYQYVKHKVNKSNEFYFDTELVISFNQFNRIDMTMQIINKNIKLAECNNIKLAECNNIKINDIHNRFDIDRLIETDKLKLFEQFNDDIVANIAKLKNEYINFHGRGILDSITWIDNLYRKINDILQIDKLNSSNVMSNVNVLNEIISLLYFGGLFEWYHLMIITNHMENNKDKKCCLYLGEISIFNWELELKYTSSIKELKQFCTSRYAFHAVTFIVDKNNILMYDPDDDEINKDSDSRHERMASVKRICSIINKQDKTHEIRLNHPIQSLSMCDKYCIYHVIVLILNIGQSKKYNYYKVKKYILKLDKINPKLSIHKILSNIDKLIDLSIQYKK